MADEGGDVDLDELREVLRKMQRSLRDAKRAIRQLEGRVAQLEEEATKPRPIVVKKASARKSAEPSPTKVLVRKATKHSASSGRYPRGYSFQKGPEHTIGLVGPRAVPLLKKPKTGKPKPTGRPLPSAERDDTGKPKT